ncbi:MAG: PaaX family transcriptional regulator C-terminal domain-containing protein [Homoserinimonas sp.]
MILDDFDARPGSATSLLRTIVGAHLRPIGGQAPIAHLITLMEAVGVSPVSTRTAVLRVKTKGLLSPSIVDGHAGYRLNPEAVPMLERGDRRIYSFRQQGDGDKWCLISYSIPETQRDARHQLRRRLGWIGCGTVATGLWICPAFLIDEVEEILSDLNLRDTATLFVASSPRLSGSPAEAASRWWDLERLAALHRRFLERHTDATSFASSQDAFSRYVHALDDWRIIPYLDPGLPPRALPADWPGFDSVALFGRLTSTLAAPAEAYVRGVVG